MSTDTTADPQPKQRGERTDRSIKRLPGGKGWRARPTLGTEPRDRQAGTAYQGVPHQERGAAVGHREAPAVGGGDVGTEVESDVR